MNDYKPNWQRIIFLAVLINFFAVFVISFGWKNLTPEVEVDNLQKIEWFEETSDNAEIAKEISEPEETFPEIKFPPIEIPSTPENFLPITFSETSPPPQEKNSSSENEIKTSDNPQEKLKVISKVFPRDVAAELQGVGTFSESLTLKSEKIILEVTVGTNGAVKNVSIVQGESNLINILAEAAATRWIFEPFKNDGGEVEEIKTQIEFKPEDF